MVKSSGKKARKPRKQNLDLSKLIAKDVGDIPPFHLQNVVSTFNLGVTGLNLRYIANKHKFMEFNPQTFAAGTIRVKEPRSTALAFASAFATSQLSEDGFFRFRGIRRVLLKQS